VYVAVCVATSMAASESMHACVCFVVYLCLFHCVSVSVSVSVPVSMSVPVCMSVPVSVSVYVSISVSGSVSMSSFTVSMIVCVCLCQCLCLCYWQCECVCVLSVISVAQRSVCCSVRACVYCLFMGWLRLVGSLKSYVSFAEYRLFYRALLQKRPMILRSLLIVATPYLLMWPPRLGTKGADLQEMSNTNLRHVI